MADRLSNVIRRKFVDYFTSKHGHQFIKSSPVRPESDKSIAFVNAGMNQFKPMFLEDRPNYPISRVCNYQKCIRVGGKMCDLNTIGHDFRHHSFFEMLGNWSFNDYYKPQACEWALDFLINHLKLDHNRLSVTYFKGPHEMDEETRSIWKKLGFDESSITANETGDNFWEMGDSGPCGMSTEIFYQVDEHELLEIWNLVFIDRQRLSGSGKIEPLQNRFVDTGMGLERILSVLEGTKSNYETDLFKNHLKIIESKSQARSYGRHLNDPLDIDYRKLADHSRMITVALADGIQPGRRGASFDLRSMIKRTILLIRDQFGLEQPRYLLFDLIDETISSLSEAYPELGCDVKGLRRVVAHESKRYLEFLDKQGG